MVAYWLILLLIICACWATCCTSSAWFNNWVTSRAPPVPRTEPPAPAGGVMTRATAADVVAMATARRSRMTHLLDVTLAPVGTTGVQVLVEHRLGLAVRAQAGQRLGIQVGAHQAGEPALGNQVVLLGRRGSQGGDLGLVEQELF